MAEETKIAIKLKEETKDIHQIIESLLDSIKHEFKKGVEHIEVDEMKEAMDMLKDACESKKSIIEACYYTFIMEAMERSESEEEEDPAEEMRKGYRGQRRSSTTGRYMRRGYDEMMMPMEREEMTRMRDMDYGQNRMYYSSGGSSGGSSNGSSGGISGGSGQSGNSSGSSGGGSRGYESYQRDYREGGSGQARRGYIESKEMNKDNSPESKQKKMKELENYMRELSDDVTEMIGDSSPEEKNLLKAKMQALIQKIG